MFSSEFGVDTWVTANETIDTFITMILISIITIRNVSSAMAVVLKEQRIFNENVLEYITSIVMSAIFVAMAFNIGAMLLLTSLSPVFTIFTYFLLLYLMLWLLLLLSSLMLLLRAVSCCNCCFSYFPLLP